MPRDGKHRLGTHHSSETKQKMSQAKLTERNPNWKGDDVGYEALHHRIKKILPKPDTCYNCGKYSRLELSNISGEYKTDLTDWQWLCLPCHAIFNDKIQNLKIGVHVERDLETGRYVNSGLQGIRR